LIGNAPTQIYLPASEKATQSQAIATTEERPRTRAFAWVPAFAGCQLLGEEGEPHLQLDRQRLGELDEALDGEIEELGACIDAGQHLWRRLAREHQQCAEHICAIAVLQDLEHQHIERLQHAAAGHLAAERQKRKKKNVLAVSHIPSYDQRHLPVPEGPTRASRRSRKSKQADFSH
jgi:hypothetical protein